MLGVTYTRVLSGAVAGFTTTMASLGLFWFSWIPRFIGLILWDLAERLGDLSLIGIRTYCQPSRAGFFREPNDRGRTPDGQYGRGVWW